MPRQICPIGMKDLCGEGMVRGFAPKERAESTRGVASCG